MTRRANRLQQSAQLSATFWLIAMAITMASALWTAPAWAVPSFNEVRAAHRVSDAVLLDRHGEPLQTLRTDFTVRRLNWVPLTDMSPALLKALVLSEDQRFWQHSGIDWSGVARSAWANAWNTRTQGASTLTMQLAGLIDEGLARPAHGRSVAQKLGQAWTARQLEARWTKHQILEAYLNSVPLRGELVGVEALSQSFFAKHAHGLDTQEAALTAALVRAPNAPVVRVAERACGVLQLQRLPCTGIEALARQAFARRGGAAMGESLAPHLARQLLKPGGPAQVRSTLDGRMQRLAHSALREALAELHRRHVEDGAVVVLDNHSGEVLAWVGSSGPTWSDAPQVDGVLARRQPGSTLKPFVYGLALEQRLITAASLLHDAPLDLPTANGQYAPQNYDRRYRGWVSAREALAGSLNVPAVRVAAMLPPDALLQRLNALGLDLQQTGSYYGQALALGSAEVSLLGLTNAYRTLANQGHWRQVHRQMDRPEPTGEAASRQPPALARADESRRAADPAATYIVADILADNAARAASFGLDSALALPGWAAVKTGTSKDLRDNWCVGFSSRYTVGVWVGNASGAPMHDVSGVSGAAPVWRRLMLALHEGQAWGPPSLPSELVQLAVRDVGAMGDTQTEWFLKGTELTTVAARTAGQPHGHAPSTFGIQHPQDGSRFALDPDIPAPQQRLVFEGADGRWQLNGKPLGTGRRIAWPLWPGRHALRWSSLDGQQTQTVRFEVRGAHVPQHRSGPERRVAETAR